MTAFAEVQDLAVRLQVELSESQSAAVQALLEDATAELQDLIGQKVTAGSATYTAKVRVCDGALTLPQQPVRSVQSVAVNGTSWTYWELVDGVLHFSRYGGLDDSRLLMMTGSRFGYVDVQVAFTYGLTVVPAVLKTWCIALALQALGQTESTGTIGSGSLISQRIDDFAENYAAGEQQTAWFVPPAVVERLRAKFGVGAYVLGSRR